MANCGRSFRARHTTLFINGRRWSGYLPRAALEEVVERERRSVALTLASGVPPAHVYAERARKNLLNLGVDPPARACVPVADAPTFGPADAPVTLVEFTDLECELCRQGEAALSAALKSTPNDVRVVWKNFPLPQHHRARLAAVCGARRSQRGGRSRLLQRDESLARATRLAR